MALKAKAPVDVIPTKPKFMISGESGVGKTFFALDFPKPYLIDSEGGATREQYQEKLRKSGGAYFGKEEGSQDFKAVIEEVKALTTTKHEYKTLIIDSFTYLYMLEAAIAEEKIGSEYSKDKKEANKPSRQLVSCLEKLDMNIILICHSKVKWVRHGKELASEGSTFDGYDKLEYILDLWIEILKRGKTFEVKKSRINSLIQGESYPLSFEKFKELYGADTIDRDSIPVELAKPESIFRIKSLIEGLKIDEETQQKWFKKCAVEGFEEMSEIQIQSLIEFLEKQVLSLSMQKVK